MSLITGKFFIFLCILFVMYYTLPKKYQWILLLSGSLFFYFSSKPVFFLFLLPSAITTFLCGKFIHNKENKYRLSIIVITIAINIGILFAVKYIEPLFDTITYATGAVLPKVEFMLPLGISFYTFMAISYVVDVYKGEVEPQDNFLKYLLYVSFFPQIIEGPINRYKDMKDILFSEHSFDFNRCKNAGYRILIGLFKKVVIAGRFSVYVDRVFDNVHGYGGLTLLCATVFYVIQLYADFSGCMDMVIGIGELFGIKMTENFNLPLFSKNVSEFWRRWHISLGAWFRDYIYYPVFRSEFSKKVKTKLSKTPLKKSAMNIVAAISLFCVWFFTGLWHGGEMHYVVWGLYYAVILIASMLLTNRFKKMGKKYPQVFDTKWWGFIQIIRTLFIVTLGELIFRANTVRDALYMIKKIATDFSLSFGSIQDAILPFTEDNTAVAYGGVAIVCFVCLFITELFEFNGKYTFKKHKYLNAVILIVVTLLFGVFGQSGFLYMAY